MVNSHYCIPNTVFFVVTLVFSYNS